MNPEIKSLISLDSGDDQWGWANGHMFAICDVLYAYGEEIPEAWQYVNPWPRSHVLDRLIESDANWPEADHFQLYADGEVTADDLRHAGEVLRRYINALRTKGLDY